MPSGTTPLCPNSRITKKPMTMPGSESGRDTATASNRLPRPLPSISARWRCSAAGTHRASATPVEATAISAVTANTRRWRAEVSTAA